MNRTHRSAITMTLILTLIGLVAVVSTTYAWLGISRVPFVSDLSVYVITENGLFIAPDEDGQPGEWTTYLDVSEFFENMTPLKPTTYKDGDFEKVLYDAQGRTAGTEPLEEENYNQRYPAGDTKSALAKEAEQKGYMVALPIWMKTDGKDADVYLSEAVERVDGQMGSGTYVIGEPVWDQESVSHQNGGHGSETTIRFGFKTELVDPVTLEGDNEEYFVIYEPNADIHADGSTGTQETFRTDGTALIDNAHLILQRASSWQEQSPVLKGSVIYSTGEFIQNPSVCRVEQEQYTKMTIYIWMEGQDSDCIAQTVANEVSLLANIQFSCEEETNREGPDVHRY